MKIIAVGAGITNHILFVLAVSLMAVQLYTGLTLNPLIDSPAPIVTNFIALFQFPILHSYFLSKKGSLTLVNCYSNKQLGKRLLTTSYTTVASLQILFTFSIWSPSNIELWSMTHNTNLLWFFNLLYISSWLFLAAAMVSAGLGIQAGYLGWTAALKNRDPQYPNTFPSRGPFKLCRQPIYLAFALITWTSPFMTLDKLILAITWSGYCYWGPRLKEVRYLKRWGAEFRSYQKNVSYFLPRLSFRR